MPLHDDDDLSNVIYPEKLKELLEQAYDAGHDAGVDSMCLMEGVQDKWELSYENFEEWYKQNGHLT